MYNPIQDGIEKNVQSVRYTEGKPPSDLAEFIHCFWELKTVATLSDDFHLHAVPDACVNIMFNQVDVSIAGITALRTTHEVLNLGKSFHYVGVQLLPGVWQGNREEIADQYIGTSYTGDLPLLEVNGAMKSFDFTVQQSMLAELVRQLADRNTVVANRVTAEILAEFDEIHTVADMAHTVGLSPRQLQRTLKQATGLAPHDFLKVVRLQQAFREGYLLLYTDQSHYIRSFHKITGYTPERYFRKFDV